LFARWQPIYPDYISGMLAPAVQRRRGGWTTVMATVLIGLAALAVRIFDCDWADFVFRLRCSEYSFISAAI